ncbi:MAG: outer membrane protein assembly factor BamB [Limnohabitans sp.]|nr:outer membrane protein assembly factor BamB [Limnohabitans sp.]
MKQTSSWPWLRFALLGAAVVVLAACSNSPDKPQPAALPAVTGQLSVQKQWNTQIGPVNSPLFASVHGHQIAVASSAGQVALLDARTGKDVWRLNLGTAVQAGLGGDGRRFALVTPNNQVMAIESGRVVWRYTLPALTLTPPLVAGERVFVLSADRTVTALDGATGQKLWAQQRTGDPLVLREPGLLTSFGDNLLVGWGGRMAALNPINGLVRWEASVGMSRGTNEVERLVDVVAGVSRQGNTVCARAFQSSVACIDALRGATLWNRSAQGHLGLGGDEKLVFGAESDSKVQAWQRQNGQPVWTQEALRFRGLTAPVVVGRAVVLGDEGGLLHFLNHQDGLPLQRVSTDGSAITGRPVVVDGVLVVVTRNGGVFGFRPE